jgi:hypothetical protein
MNREKDPIHLSPPDAPKIVSLTYQKKCVAFSSMALPLPCLLCLLRRCPYWPSISHVASSPSPHSYGVPRETTQFSVWSQLL